MIIKDFHIDTIRRAIGHELMLVRWQKGITQKQMSDKFHISPKY